MIKAILFDLDGVLIDNTKELHYQALNTALEEISPSFIINREEQHTIFEALATKQKLKLLSDLKKLPIEHHQKILDRKQELTKQLLTTLPFDNSYAKRSWLLRLKNERRVSLAVCTNTIPETTHFLLDKLKLHGDVFEVVLTNADVKNSKPNPEIYIKAQNLFNIYNPRETLVVEDSENGSKAGRESGAYVFKINKATDALYVSRVLNAITRIAPLAFPRYEGIIIPFITIDQYNNGQSYYSWEIKCPSCGIIHKQESKHLKNTLLQNKFTGKCRQCSVRSSRPDTSGVNNHNWRKWKRQSTGAGYILLSIFHLSDDDKLLAQEMVNHKKRKDTILEHRLVMAKHLNRPLLRHEIVHHKNGKKHDNDLTNLELLTIKSHHSGHGDSYYQKWQEAEQRIKELETQLKVCKCRN